MFKISHRNTNGDEVGVQTSFYVECINVKCVSFEGAVRGPMGWSGDLKRQNGPQAVLFIAQPLVSALIGRSGSPARA